jgi:hypothetical protein
MVLGERSTAVWSKGLRPGSRSSGIVPCTGGASACRLAAATNATDRAADSLILDIKGGRLARGNLMVMAILNPEFS